MSGTPKTLSEMEMRCRRSRRFGRIMSSDCPDDTPRLFFDTYFVDRDLECVPSTSYIPVSKNFKIFTLPVITYMCFDFSYDIVWGYLGQ